MSRSGASLSTAKLLAAAMLVALAPTACTGDGSSGVSNDASGAQATVQQALDPDRQPPAVEIEGATRGGTVTVRRDYGVGSVDPTVWDISTADILSGLVTRSLTQYVFDPDQRSVVLVPDIATDLGTPNADYTEWTYTIREGVRFEDGTPVTAEDVAYGIKRSFDRKALAVEGAPISSIYFLHGDTYRGPYQSGTDYDGVVVDGDRLTLKMARPFPEMPYWGASSAMGPIPETGSTPEEYARHPLSTGPYKFADYKPGESFTLVKNPEWDPATDPGRHQYPDRFEFRFTDPMDKVESALLADRSGAQTSLTNLSVSPETVQTAEAEDPERLLLGPANCTHFMWPDNRDIDEVKVRQALGYAFPYEDFWRIQGQDLGVTRLPATSTLLPGTPGRIDEPVLSGEPWQTDPDRAKALLREAGYADGDYTLTFAYVDPDFAYKDLLVTAFERAGFKVAPYRTTWEQVDALVEDPAAPVNLRFGGWCPDWPSGAGYLESLFTRGGAANFSFFHEKSVDDEFARIETLPLTEQAAAIGSLDRLIQTKYYPAVVTGYDGVALLHGSRIGGMNLGAYGAPTYKDLYVAR